jgi:hypothetical protein
MMAKMPLSALWRRLLEHIQKRELKKQSLMQEQLITIACTTDTLAYEPQHILCMSIADSYHTTLVLQYETKKNLELAIVCKYLEQELVHAF